eukprot:scaffold7090_cov452-Pinguiococcus_pyrenoidosus.AAC.1
MSSLPRKTSKPILRAGEGSTIGDRVEEGVSSRGRLGIAQQRASCQRVRIGELVVRRRRGALQNKERVHVIRRDHRLRDAGRVSAELDGGSFGEDDVRRGPVQEVNPSDVRWVRRESLCTAVAVQDTLGPHVGDHDVRKVSSRALAEADHGRLRVVAGGRVRVVEDVAHEVHIHQLRERAKLSRTVWPVHFGSVVGVVAEDHVGELDASGVALVRIDGVVSDEQHRQVLHIDGAAEELHAVVEVEGHFDVIHSCSSAYTSEGDAVDLVVGADHGSAVPDAH